MASKLSEWCFLHLKFWFNWNSTFGSTFSSSQKSKLAIKLRIRKDCQDFCLYIVLITFCKLTVLQMQFLISWSISFTFWILYFHVCANREKKFFLSSRLQRIFHECLGKLTANMTRLRKRVHKPCGRDEVSLFLCVINRYPWTIRSFLPGALPGRHPTMACCGCTPWFSDSREEDIPQWCHVFHRFRSSWFASGNAKQPGLLLILQGDYGDSRLHKVPSAQ